jgi:hypothetical protein
MADYGQELPPLDVYEQSDPFAAIDFEGVTVTKNFDDRVKLRANAFSWPLPSAIPPRNWLWGRWLISGEITEIVAPGGVGKSTLTIGVALSLATGRAILGRKVWPGPVPVWLLNLEDDATELARGITAAAMHHGIDASDCENRLYVDSGVDQPLCVATETANGAQIVEPVFDALRAEIQGRGIRALIIDPFVSSHGINESDNGAVNMVAKRWKRLASETNCAIVLVHHTRKGNGEALSADSSRGASALANAARVVLTINRMTTQEATGWDITPDQRRLYFWVADDKANRAPPEPNAWFKLASVALGNSSPVHPQGDLVGAVECWIPPNAFDGVTEDDLRKVQAVMAGGDWREHVKADQWAGKAVSQAMGLDPEIDKHRIKQLLKTWIDNGVLCVVSKHDSRAGRDTKFIEVGRPAI